MSALDDEAALHPGPEVNVGPFERAASITLGTALVALALSGRARGRVSVAGLGAYLAWRGAGGRCLFYELLDTGTSGDEEDERLAAGAHDDVSLEAAMTIGRPPQDVYAYVRDFTNAPRFMAFIQSVEPLEEGRWRWVARMPAGHLLEWEAEVLEDRPGELIVWRSVPESLVHHAGAVRFRPAPGGRGTEVRLDIEYSPPGAPLGRAIARLFGSATEYVAEEDLRRLKQLLEAGETATTRGQPHGRGPCVAEGRP